VDIIRIVLRGWSVEVEVILSIVVKRTMYLPVWNTFVKSMAMTHTVGASAGKTTDLLSVLLPPIGREFFNLKT
jgi:hypothetical protein